jgi:hypothetical protein
MYTLCSQNLQQEKNHAKDMSDKLVQQVEVQFAVQEELRRVVEKLEMIKEEKQLLLKTNQQSANSIATLEHLSISSLCFFPLLHSSLFHVLFSILFE